MKISEDARPAQNQLIPIHTPRSNSRYRPIELPPLIDTCPDVAINLDPETAELYKNLSRTSQKAFRRLLMIGSDPVEKRRIRHMLPLKAKPRPITYTQKLINSGYRFVKINDNLLSYHLAFLVALQRMRSDHPDCPQNIDHLIYMISNEVSCNPDKYKGSIHALVIGEIWEAVRLTDESLLNDILAKLPEPMRGPLAKLFYDYWESEDQEKDSVIDALNDWAWQIGAQIYMDAMQQGYIFGGTLEADIISKHFNIAITFHRLVDAKENGIANKIGDEIVPDKDRLHLYYAHGGFSWLLHPEQWGLVPAAPAANVT